MAVLSASFGFTLMHGQEATQQLSKPELFTQAICQFMPLDKINRSAVISYKGYDLVVLGI